MRTNFFGIQLGFKTADRLSQQVGLLGAVHGDIIALGFNPVDLAGLQKVNAPGGFDDQAFQIFIPGLQFFQQRQDALIHAAIAISL